jgi:hypothetical protein
VFRWNQICKKLTKPSTDTVDRSQCVYRLPHECGREYIGGTGRTVNIRIREHKSNLRDSLFDKSRLASHACEEEHGFVHPYYSLNLKLYIENIKRQPIFCARANQSVISTTHFPLIDKELTRVSEWVYGLRERLVQCRSFIVTPVKGLVRLLLAHFIYVMKFF